MCMWFYLLPLHRILPLSLRWLISGALSALLLRIALQVRHMGCGRFHCSIYWSRSTRIRVRGCIWRREACLLGARTVFAASAAAHANTTAEASFLDAFPTASLIQSKAERLWNGPFFAPPNGTLDGALLDDWSRGPPRYDALFMRNWTDSASASPGLPFLAAAGQSEASSSWTLIIQVILTIHRDHLP